MEPRPELQGPFRQSLEHAVSATYDYALDESAKMRSFARMKTTALLLLALCLAGCGGDSLRPSVFTAPLGYLDSFPLGMSRDDLAAKVGPPDRETTNSGRTTWSYDFGQKGGKRTWAYEMVNDRVDDVRYFDSGPYSGSSAKKRQADATAASPAK